MLELSKTELNPVDRFRLPGKLKRVLSIISGDPEIEYLTNYEVVERLMEEGRLK